MGKNNWNPWAENMPSSDGLESDLARPKPHTGTLKGRVRWRPVADIYETHQTLVLQIELPGLRLEDVAVEVKHRELLVFGVRPFERDVQGAAYHSLERGHGHFSRRFPLPPQVKAGAITATLKDGLLTVVVPKHNRTDTNRRIPIETP
jgi:HSP20 family protein